MNYQQVLVSGILCVVLVTAGCLGQPGGEISSGELSASADTDGDGVEDDTEVVDHDSDPMAADTDGDGLDDGMEVHETLTRPTATDSDGDGLSDWAEVTAHDTGPMTRDSDGDGLEDGTEISGETDPINADTDDDALKDGVEVTRHGTVPTTADTDGDGLADGAEVGTHESDPLRQDTDSDGLDDAAEVNQHGTDPSSGDTDGDGLTDQTEIDGGTNPIAADTDGDGLTDLTEVDGDTDPLAADTDRDQLVDGREASLGTDPTNADTDGDGLPDGSEMKREALSEADPLQMDVFLEVDYATGMKPSKWVFATAEAVYADAPVTNPDGTTGISLHVIVDDEIATGETVTKQELDETVMPEQFDREGDGFRYALAVEDARVEGRDRIGGVAGGKNCQFLFEMTYRDSESVMDASDIAKIVLHELGHSVGIAPEDHEGVDSTQVQYSDYSSVMNYDAPRGNLRYNTGEPFDDWEHIRDHMATPPLETE